MSRKHNLSLKGEDEPFQEDYLSPAVKFSERTLRDLLKAIEDDEVALPSLPEVALKVREAAESPDVSIGQLASVIGTDTALTARILKVVNSPLLRSGWEIVDLHAAIGRLGLVYTSNLAVGLAMEQMFRSKSQTVDRKLRLIWSRSLTVAGVGHAICRRRTDLNADQATLAGIVHKIGVLPILAYADQQNLQIAPAELDSLIDEIHPIIGHRILTQWDFPEQLAEVPRGYLDLARVSDHLDYVDVVQAASIIASQGSNGRYAKLDWSSVSSLRALALKPGEANQYLDEAAVLAG